MQRLELRDHWSRLCTRAPLPDNARESAMKRPWMATLAALSAATLVWTTFCPANLAADLDPLDWPYWRGPEGNSISRETGLPDTINPGGKPGSGDGSNLLWKRDDLGGRSTPIVMRGKLYTIL